MLPHTMTIATTAVVTVRNICPPPLPEAVSFASHRHTPNCIKFGTQMVGLFPVTTKTRLHSIRLAADDQNVDIGNYVDENSRCTVQS